MVIKGRTHLHNPAIERSSFFKFAWRFDTTCHQGVNKINVYGYLSRDQKLLKIKQKG